MSLSFLFPLFSLLLKPIVLKNSWIVRHISLLKSLFIISQFWWKCSSNKIVSTFPKCLTFFFKLIHKILFTLYIVLHILVYIQYQLSSFSLLGFCRFLWDNLMAELDPDNVSEHLYSIDRIEKYIMKKMFANIALFYSHTLTLVWLLSPVFFQGSIHFRQ